MKWIEIGAEDVVVMTAAPQLYSKWPGVTVRSVPSLPARHIVSSRHRRAPFPIPIRSSISIPTVSCSEAGSARLSISTVFVGSGHLHSSAEDREERHPASRKAASPRLYAANRIENPRNVSSIGLSISNVTSSPGSNQ